MATLSSNSSQSYFLRFSSHSAALSRSLLGLLSESYCTDVHISTGHQSQTIRAHKIILSAFSPYFKSLFSSLPSNQFPVIIIREISYDILRTIIEFCYRGEILVSRDKLDDIVSAAKFLQIEGAKDFILPKHSQSQVPHHSAHQPQQHQYHNNAAGAANNRMQTNLQQMSAKANNNQKQSLIAQQQSQQQHKTMSLLSRLVQKPPLTHPSRNAGAEHSSTAPIDNSMPIISSVRHINENELIADQTCVKQEVLDEEVVDEEEEEEDIDEGEDVGEPSGAIDGQKSADKSGMFAEFEDQSIVSNNNNKSFSNESTNRHSEEDSNDEPMDTSATAMGQILAKVPPGTSVSTTVVGADTSGGVQHKSDNLNVPSHESDEELIEEEEEEYEDEFDEEEEEGEPTNPLDLLNVNMSETGDESHQLDTQSLHMSSATARAIAASTLASFNTNIDLDSECSTSQSSQSAANQFGSNQSVTITAIGGGLSASERRGRGRPPKYEIGSGFPPQPTTSSTPSITISAPGSQTADSPPPSMSIMASTSSAESSAAANTRSRRGRPPSMPEELLRSLTGRLDKAHHKCPHCPQIYYGYHAMRDHITSVHLNSGEKYICNLCNKEYTWRITLRKHLKFHHGVHPDQVQNA